MAANVSDDSDGRTLENGHESSTSLHDWDSDPRNPLNFSGKDKAILMLMISLTCFVVTVGSSIISPSQMAIQQDFGVTETEALLPLSLYVFALAFGPVVGGPLSETVGRMPCYYIPYPLGMLFTLGAGFTHNFGALCFLRFAAGFCWAPTMSVGTGSIAETFDPKARGLMMALFILMPFLGPGFGPLLGAYATSRQSWRWTQWVLEFFSVACLVLIALAKETYPPVIKRRIAKERGEKVAVSPPVMKQVREFLVTALLRPVHMLFTEPIVLFICLYVAINFGVLFSFFAAVPYMVVTVHHFTLEQSGLVFISVIIGCIFGLVTIIVCDGAFYKPQAAKYPAGKVPPEYRLHPAMIGSFGLPIGLFWFAWTSKPEISWASPIAAIIPYAWGNLCVFVSSAQYITDTYHGNIVASASSANTLARYLFAGAFPLFIIHMFEGMGLDWAITLFAFVTVALLPIPWILFKFGAKIRARSKYETIV